MKIFYTILFSLTFILTANCQDLSNSFNTVLKANLKKYNIQCDIAFENRETAKGNMLFDSLVAKHLVGTSFEDYTLKSFEKRKVTLSSFKKPVFILTYASWCVPSKGEIPALNKLAQKYAKEVQFVLLFWDKKRDVKQIAKKFNHNITVCYANESYKNDAPIVANLKHTLGFPTSYFLDENLKVVNIKRGGAQPQMNSTYIKAYTMNYNTFRDGLSILLLEKNINKEQLTTN